MPKNPPERARDVPAGRKSGLANRADAKIRRDVKRLELENSQCGELVTDRLKTLKLEGRTSMPSRGAGSASRKALVVDSTLFAGARLFGSWPPTVCFVWSR